MFPSTASPQLDVFSYKLRLTPKLFPSNPILEQIIQVWIQAGLILVGVLLWLLGVLFEFDMQLFESAYSKWKYAYSVSNILLYFY